MKKATKEQLTEISKVDPKALRKELRSLLCKLSPENLRNYRQRIIDGQIVGDLYIDEDCGCIYGTAAILENPDTDNQYNSVNRWLINHFPNILKSRSFRNEPSTASPLEEIAFHIDRGDTPEDNAFSAWLLTEVDAYSRD